MEEKPRLTDQQKKKNHIISEKKRREAIRAGFEDLASVIPDCEGQARSEALVLQRTVIYATKEVKKKDKLKKLWVESGRNPAEFDQSYRDSEARVRARKAGEAEKTDNDDQEVATAATRATPAKATRTTEGKATRATPSQTTRAPQPHPTHATEAKATRTAGNENPFAAGNGNPFTPDNDTMFAPGPEAMFATENYNGPDSY